jgi:glutamate synthase (NADPH/NADH) small chain
VKDGRPQFVEVAGTVRVLPCDLALLAIGFVGAEKGTLLDELGVELDQRENIKTENYMTTKDGIFSAGDMRRGQSLVVWAISEGREAARAVDVWLMGRSTLESKDESLVSLEQMAT